MKRLIVAADDFGLTKSVNQGIVRAYEEGIVTSLNLLPSGDAFDDAVSLARKIGLDEVGAHLAVTETLPVTQAPKISSLVDGNGRFCKGHTQFFAKFIFGSIRMDEVYAEWRAQVEKVSAAGIKITNLSTHEHIHMLPELLKILIRIAREFNIPAVRYPHADCSSRRIDINILVKKLTLSYFEGNIARTLSSSGLAAPEHFLGFFDSGHVTETVLLDMIASLEDGVTELVSHPGFLGREILERYLFHKNSEAELFALTSPRVKSAIEKRHIGLISYAEFLSTKI